MFGYIKKSDVLKIIERESKFQENMFRHYIVRSNNAKENGDADRAAMLMDISDDYFERYLECKDLYRRIEREL